jgi:hypothetical protein
MGNKGGFLKLLDFRALPLVEKRSYGSRRERGFPEGWKMVAGG